jgi:ADP-ribose pyrophosphatase
MIIAEQTLSTEYKFKGRIISLRVDTVSLPGGKTSTREVCEHRGGVGILPLHSDGTVTLVRQHRYAVEKALVEVPAGKLEVGEEPQSCAVRELEEECGLKATKIVRLGKIFPSCGFLTEVIHLYLARELTPCETCPDEDEYIELLRLPFEDALEMARSGGICDAKTIAALFFTEGLISKEGGFFETNTYR